MLFFWGFLTLFVIPYLITFYFIYVIYFSVNDVEAVFDSLRWWQFATIHSRWKNHTLMFLYSIDTQPLVWAESLLGYFRREAIIRFHPHRYQYQKLKDTMYSNRVKFFTFRVLQRRHWKSFTESLTRLFARKYKFYQKTLRKMSRNDRQKHPYHRTFTIKRHLTTAYQHSHPFPGVMFYIKQFVEFFFDFITGKIKIKVEIKLPRIKSDLEKQIFVILDNKKYYYDDRFGFYDAFKQEIIQNDRFDSLFWPLKPFYVLYCWALRFFRMKDFYLVWKDIKWQIRAAGGYQDRYADFIIPEEVTNWDSENFESWYDSNTTNNETYRRSRKFWRWSYYYNVDDRFYRIVKGIYKNLHSKLKKKTFRTNNPQPIFSSIRKFYQGSFAEHVYYVKSFHTPEDSFSDYRLVRRPNFFTIRFATKAFSYKRRANLSVFVKSKFDSLFAPTRVLPTSPQNFLYKKLFFKFKKNLNTPTRVYSDRPIVNFNKISKRTQNNSVSRKIPRVKQLLQVRSLRKFNVLKFKFLEHYTHSPRSVINDLNKREYFKFKLDLKNPRYISRRDRPAGGGKNFF